MIELPNTPPETVTESGTKIWPDTETTKMAQDDWGLPTNTREKILETLDGQRVRLIVYKDDPVHASPLLEETKEHLLRMKKELRSLPPDEAVEK